MRHSDDPPRLPWYGGCAAYGQELDWGRFRFHRAAMLAAANRSLESIDVPGQALALKPNDARNRWDRGLNHLLPVDYARRWPGKIWRVERYPGDHSDPIGADVGERMGDQMEKEKSLRPLFRHYDNKSCNLICGENLECRIQVKICLKSPNMGGFAGGFNLT